MLVLAISAKGQEFFYKASSCRAVSKASAEKIRDALNERSYLLKPGQVWHIHELDNYSNGASYAERQKFTIRKETIYDKR